MHSLLTAGGDLLGKVVWRLSIGSICEAYRTAFDLQKGNCGWNSRPPSPSKAAAFRAQHRSPSICAQSGAALVILRTASAHYPLIDAGCAQAKMDREAEPASVRPLWTWQDPAAASMSVTCIAWNKVCFCLLQGRYLSCSSNQPCHTQRQEVTAGAAGTAIGRCREQAPHLQVASSYSCNTVAGDSSCAHPCPIIQTHTQFTSPPAPLHPTPASMLPCTRSCPQTHPCSMHWCHQVPSCLSTLAPHTHPGGSKPQRLHRPAQMS